MSDEKPRKPLFAIVFHGEMQGEFCMSDYMTNEQYAHKVARQAQKIRKGVRLLQEIPIQGGQDDASSEQASERDGGGRDEGRTDNRDGVLGEQECGEVGDSSPGQLLDTTA